MWQGRRFRCVELSKPIPHYNTNVRSKAAGYVHLADMLKEGEITIHKGETYRQLLSIEGATLRAPERKMTTMLYRQCSLRQQRSMCI